jgi:hypothetical protein
MKNARLISTSFFCLILFASMSFANTPSAGFSLPDSVSEMTLRYRTVRGLIILPVTINDSIEVNLILDTGCRNLILFGNRFTNLFKINAGRPIEFSGLGSGKPVRGKLSLGNKVSIQQVLGEQIPVVLVSSKNLFGNYPGIHGVIGYDIFVRFEIELNPGDRTISFRPASGSRAPAGYTSVPLRIQDARPVMQSHIFVNKNKKRGRLVDLMIDTGSSLGLLLKTTNISEFKYEGNETVLGIGLNGPVSGYETISNKLVLTGMEMEAVPTGIVSSEWHNNASIGMDILKDYIVILNYCEAYACFKRREA